MILLGIDLHGALVHVKYLIGVFMNFIIVFFHHAPQAAISLLDADISGFLPSQE
jgi:hypothetical protein